MTTESDDKKVVVGETEYGSTYFETVEEETPADIQERVDLDKRKDGWFNWSKP